MRLIGFKKKNEIKTILNFLSRIKYKLKFRI
jgi:hypothetical protein